MSTGIGNLYKAEVLFLRGVNPWQPAGGVADLGAMAELARRLLDANKDRIGQVTTGNGAGARRPGCTGDPAARAGWSERRYHLAGCLGAALSPLRGAQVDRDPGGRRIVSVTEAGQAGLRDWLGIDLAELRAAALARCKRAGGRR